jgi:5-methylcytosine-specific restriction endonuclease McrA
MSSGTPQRRPKSDFKDVTTLRGMSHQDRIDFSWNCMRKFFKVTLYDRSRTCAGCYKPIETLAEATLDHIVPRSKGGRTRLSNLQLMHSKCNSRKTNTMPDHYSRNAFTPPDSHRGTVTKFMIKRGITNG